MGLLDKLTSENPNVVLMVLGIIIGILYMYSADARFSVFVYVPLGILSAIVFLTGFAGLVKTQSLKDKKMEQEIELIKEQIKTGEKKRIFNHKKLF